MREGDAETIQWVHRASQETLPVADDMAVHNKRWALERLTASQTRTNNIFLSFIFAPRSGFRTRAVVRLADILVQTSPSRTLRSHAAWKDKEWNEELSVEKLLQGSGSGLWVVFVLRLSHRYHLRTALTTSDPAILLTNIPILLHPNVFSNLPPFLLSDPVALCVLFHAIFMVQTQGCDASSARHGVFSAAKTAFDDFPPMSAERTGIATPRWLFSPARLARRDSCNWARSGRHSFARADLKSRHHPRRSCINIGDGWLIGPAWISFALALDQAGGSWVDKSHKVSIHTRWNLLTHRRLLVISSGMTFGVGTNQPASRLGRASPHGSRSIAPEL
ncbi:hypothetical protein B0H13DRAFT_2430859 [Mycena leptocephala]|nr:hypothetical protein B0H13DRAFT_2430859 [Mycena leptocephala]